MPGVGCVGVQVRHAHVPRRCRRMSANRPTKQHAASLYIYNDHPYIIPHIHTGAPRRTPSPGGRWRLVRAGRVCVSCAPTSPHSSAAGPLQPGIVVAGGVSSSVSDIVSCCRSKLMLVEVGTGRRRPRAQLQAPGKHPCQRGGSHAVVVRPRALPRPATHRQGPCCQGCHCFPVGYRAT